MRIYILKKSITDLKNPIARSEYETSAQTVSRFICEMVERNYRVRPVKDSLETCQTLACTEFCDGGYYIVNKTQNRRYTDLDELTDLAEGDEVVLIKLKYVRGFIW